MERTIRKLSKIEQALAKADAGANDLASVIAAALGRRGGRAGRGEAKRRGDSEHYRAIRAKRPAAASVRCLRCRGTGTKLQRYALLTGGLGPGSSEEFVTCIACDGEGRLGPVITERHPSGTCPCCDAPEGSHVCVIRGTLTHPTVERWCLTHKRMTH